MPQVPLVCHGHSRPIVALEYSHVTPDGVFLISSSKDGQPMLRCGDSGDWVGTFQGHKGCVWHATLNREATHAATASADFSARLWNAITGDELKSFAHKHIVKSVSFSSEGQRLLTGGSEKLLRIFDLGKPEAEPYVMSGSGSQIKTAQFIANDELILSSCAEDKGIRVWDVKSNTVVTTLSTESPVTSIEVSADGKNMTTADGKTVTFWDLQNFSKVKTWTMDYEVESASVSLKHKKFVAGGPDMWVHLHDMETGAEEQTNKGHHGPVHTVRFAPDQNSFSSGSEDGTIRIWQTVEPKD
jgi:serine-threonine kinase receptor-associated protein